MHDTDISSIVNIIPVSRQAASYNPPVLLSFYEDTSRFNYKYNKLCTYYNMYYSLHFANLTSHIAAFLPVVLITEMLKICLQTSYHQNVQLILKSYLPVVYGTPLGVFCTICITHYISQTNYLAKTCACMKMIRERTYSHVIRDTIPESPVFYIQQYW
jgi:hypothetical protein